jgi:membrane-associated phospholipid phosphatase
VAVHDALVACFDAKYTYWAMRPVELDPAVQPLFTTPNHPSYPAAHACLSAAAAEVLGQLFPREADSIHAKAVENGMSRLWAGIHFRSDIEAGLTLGQSVGQEVVRWASAAIEP